VAIHAVRRVPPLAGATVAVLGAGPVGLLLGHVARRSGARVLIAEVSSSRRDAVARMGFGLLDTDRPLEDVRSLTDGEGADVFFDAAGSAALGPALTSYVRRGGTIAMVAAHAHPVAFDLADVMFRELTLVGQRAYLPADVRAAVTMLGDDVDALSPLVTDRVAVGDVPAALERVRAGEGLKTVVACPT
jgi:(R,R)-butanediol dehydrogenase/meso-butanediol dehydrogenase/diacetyl reductase